MGEIFTVRQALQHVLGQGVADSIIADMGGHWAKVAAVAAIGAKQDEGEQLDHIDRWFMARMRWEEGRIDDGEYHQACEEFRQDHKQASPNSASNSED